MYTWNRPILKANGRLALQNRYWLGVAVSLVALLLSGAVVALVQMQVSLSLLRELWDTMDGFFYLTPGGLHASWGGRGGLDPYLVFRMRWLWQFALLTWLLSLLALAAAIFAGGPLQVGQARYFVHNRFGDTRFGLVFSGFQQRWLNTVAVKFTTNLFVWLWSLLFVVPGVVASYRYYYVDFLLADNPGLTGARARALSRMLTDGEKGRLFVFDLSFLGWILLAGLVDAVTFFVGGSALLMPYLMASRAELYLFARDRAINAGQLDPAELNLVAG